MQSEQPSFLPSFASLKCIPIKLVLRNIKPDFWAAELWGLYECESQLSGAQGWWRAEWPVDITFLLRPSLTAFEDRHLRTPNQYLGPWGQQKPMLSSAAGDLGGKETLLGGTPLGSGSPKTPKYCLQTTPQILPEIFSVSYCSQHKHLWCGCRWIDI